MKLKKTTLLITTLLAVVLTLTACSTKKEANTNNHKVDIVTSTNIYANIAKNVVGKHGEVQAIIKNGDTDPHDFEPTTNSAKEVANANIVISNGLGYDDWMTKLADSNDIHMTKVGEELMGLKQGDNPHIWYNLDMPKKYVNYIVKRSSKIDPKHASYFRKNGQTYLNKIQSIKQLAAKIDAKHAKLVYVSEPVFDYALERCHFKIGNPAFEEAVENETDPSAQVVHNMQESIKHKKISFFVNNVQASSSTVNGMVKLANQNQIPVLKVRETMPNGTNYYHWMKNNYQNLFDIFSK
ncbi:metal ABC transporter solute-binding protein, Zn/Mn family [Lactobacillus kitasatonis]|uniref:Zinc ABC transporter substrate-binding protein n=1 Tax=Lactobacillus kitasatonis TaxID=237446 RepID=A0ABS1LV21_9LACO|nr:zinc ABC transporter substrate-binding protein [Lactobacillus kitasatonis]MBL1072107.1 zinc ABC transporter substrate-binding protein [Lactobacillus kitasatonis]